MHTLNKKLDRPARNAEKQVSLTKKQEKELQNLKETLNSKKDFSEACERKQPGK